MYVFSVSFLSFFPIPSLSVLSKFCSIRLLDRKLTRPNQQNKDVTGPQDATKGIIAIYDIFGYFDQTLQGMDILATSDASQKYRVFMPDWFKGNPCPIEWYPPNTEEKQQKVGNWFKDWNPAETAAKVPDYVKAVREKNPGIKSWGIIGVCLFLFFSLVLSLRT